MAYHELIDAKAILEVEKQWYFLTFSRENKRVHEFPKRICPKVNVIGLLEFEPVYFEVVVQ